MELSQRVRQLKPSATFAVNARVQALRAEGHDIIGFGVGEPDFDTPPGIRAAAARALEAGQTHYLPVAGAPEARAAIAEKLVRDNGIACTADDVVVTCGAKHAIFLALQALVDPGHEVVIPTPAWVSYFPMVELCGGKVVEVPAAVDRDFRITPEQLAKALRPQTRVVMINSPSNPCGTMYEPHELRELAAVIEPHPHITIIADEIYEELVFGAVEHFSLGSIASMADRVVTVNGMSKSFAMTGWRLGYAAVPGGGARAIAKLQGQMTSHATSFAQAAIPAALAESSKAEVAAMRDVFARRAALMHGLVAAIPGVRCPRPTGAFYVFPDIRAYLGRRTGAGRPVDSSQDFAAALLEEAHVAVVPGADFGACAGRHVRLGFACADHVIEEGCARLGQWCAAFDGALVER